MSTLIGVHLSGADGLGVLAFRGAEAAKFLQGQLSADTEKLMPGASTLAGLHSPQGRVIALLALVRTSADEFLAALPSELVPNVAKVLSRFVFRSRVKISDESAHWRVLGAPRQPGHSGPRIAWGERELLLVPPDLADVQTAGMSEHARWQRMDVAEGLAQVYTSTSESFVAQMLNLDLLGAIAFDKGCYTGQEVIARAHYRGRVKRRMQRWHHASQAPLAPGDAARTRDGRTLTVVRVAPGGAEGYELLAVGTFGPAAEANPEPPADRGIVVEGPLPLPYSLPE
jgi:folate-binding protein YgfZ